MATILGLSWNPQKTAKQSQIFQLSKFTIFRHFFDQKFGIFWVKQELTWDLSVKIAPQKRPSPAPHTRFWCLSFCGEFLGIFRSGVWAIWGRGFRFLGIFRSGVWAVWGQRFQFLGIFKSSKFTTHRTMGEAGRTGKISKRLLSRKNLASLGLSPGLQPQTGRSTRIILSAYGTQLSMHFSARLLF